MIHHVVGLFTHPDQEWKEIRGDQEESISHMYLTHVLLLAAIPVISAYIGTTKVGWAVGGGAPVMLTESNALQMTIMSYLAMLGGVAVMAAFVHWMARTYDATPSMAQSVVFAAYTATPLFVGGLAAHQGARGIVKRRPHDLVDEALAQRQHVVEEHVLRRHAEERRAQVLRGGNL